MRVQSGSNRGRQLRTVDSPTVRPILARIKKSVFDIIRPRISNTRFLDLYCGSGSVGIEAISQGAASATFVESDRRCLQMLRENLAAINIEAKATVVRANATTDLGGCPGPYDLIFMGPPYKDAEKNMLALVRPTLASIEKFNLLAEGGIVIAQHHKKEDPTPEGDAWESFRQERYGDTLVTFFRKRP